MLSRVMAKNVGDVFWDTLYKRLSQVSDVKVTAWKRRLIAKLLFFLKKKEIRRRWNWRQCENFDKKLGSLQSVHMRSKNLSKTAQNNTAGATSGGLKLPNLRKCQLFTALRWMQDGLFTIKLSVGPSVCQTRNLWQNEINLCTYSYTTWKIIHPSSVTKRMVGGAPPFRWNLVKLSRLERKRPFWVDIRS